MKDDPFGIKDIPLVDFGTDTGAIFKAFNRTGANCVPRLFSIWPNSSLFPGKPPSFFPDLKGSG